MDYSEYFDEMTAMGFPPHEIELCWQSENRMRILKAAYLDGERDLCASPENIAKAKERPDAR